MSEITKKGNHWVYEGLHFTTKEDAESVRLADYSYNIVDEEELDYNKEELDYNKEELDVIGSPWHDERSRLIVVYRIAAKMIKEQWNEKDVVEIVEQAAKSEKVFDLMTLWNSCEPEDQYEYWYKMIYGLPRRKKQLKELARVSHSVSRSVFQYPTLFLCETLWETQRRVWEHMFLTCGSGYKWHEDGFLFSGLDDGEEPPFELSEESFQRAFDAIGRENSTVDRAYSKFAKKRFGLTWEPYPISMYSNIVQIPDNALPDWLEAAKRIAQWTREHYDAGLSSHTDPEVAERERKAAYEWLDKIDARIAEIEKGREE